MRERTGDRVVGSVSIIGCNEDDFVFYFGQVVASKLFHAGKIDKNGISKRDPFGIERFCMTSVIVANQSPITKKAPCIARKIRIAGLPFKRKKGTANLECKQNKAAENLHLLTGFSSHQFSQII